MNLYYGEHINEIQIGVDEAGRGSMIGPVVAGAVIWNNHIEPIDIKDSKKLSRKKRDIVRKYIETNAVSFGIGYASNTEIEEMNILNATHLAMNRAISNIDSNIHYDRVLVDGNSFKSENLQKPYNCIVGGDNSYVSIAAASILAKEYHDEWFTNMFPYDDKYDLQNNKGYGTKKHIHGLKTYGITEYHRNSFCKKYIY